jgi:hypothetical protein
MDVEREYRARVAAMSVAERVRRAEALFIWSRDSLVRSILKARGQLPRRELAFRQYASDPAARQWLEELRTRAAR